MMTTNNTLSKVLMFTTGAAIGSFVTWKLLKTKYEQLAQRDIEEVRAYYDEKYNEKPKTEETEEELEEPDEREEYEDFVRNTGYANHSEDDRKRVMIWLNRMLYHRKNSMRMVTKL